MDKVEEFLQHHGVKGMRWGVRRFQPYQKGPGKPKGKFLKKVGKKVSDSRVGQEVRSAKRELSAVKSKGKMDKMSTKQIKETAKRIQSENEMKRLSKTGKEKKEYRNRERMSNQEVDRKLDRLRAKDLLSQNADKAAKKYVDLGKKVGDGASALALTYMTNNNSISVDQVYSAFTNPKDVRNKAVSKAFTDNISKIMK